MKYKGRLFLDGEQNGKVKEATVTPTRICIDWEEGGRTGHLDALSPDGMRFRGKYEYVKESGKHKFDLKLYKAKNEVLLLGTWIEEGDRGLWTFQLSKCQIKKSLPKIKQPVAKLRRPTKAKASEKATPTSSRQIKKINVAAGSATAPAKRPRAKTTSQHEPSAIANGKRKLDSTNIDSLPPVKISKELLGVTHGRKYRDGNKWVLTTKNGVRIAVFDSDSALEKWWVDFQQSQGRKPLRLGVGKAPNQLKKGKKKKIARVTSYQRYIDDLNRLRPRHQTGSEDMVQTHDPQITFPDHAHDPNMPWSEKYDIAECDYG